MVFVVIPTILLAAAISDKAFLQSWDTPKYFTWASALLLLQGVVLFMATSALPLLGRAGAGSRHRGPGCATTRSTG